MGRWRRGCDLDRSVKGRVRWAHHYGRADHVAGYSANASRRDYPADYDHYGWV